MASCSGKRSTGKNPCGGPLYKCNKCNSVGCEQAPPDSCSNQSFQNFKCIKCGASGQREVVR